MSHMSYFAGRGAMGVMEAESTHAHLPMRGLAAARIDVRALSVVVMPALAMEIVCCSITCMPRGR